MYYSDERESDKDCCERAVQFLEWLNSRPEKCIAVVTHSSFLRHLFGQFGKPALVIVPLSHAAIILTVSVFVLNLYSFLRAFGRRANDSR